MAKKGLNVVITFKSDERWLYDIICSHSSKGGWVKDILKEYLNQDHNATDRSESPLSIDSILGL